MSDNGFKIKNKLNIKPGGETLDAEGDIAFNATSHKLEVRDNSATRSMVSEDGSQTLTNKSISGATNTFSSIPSSAVASGAATTLDLATSNTDSTVNIGSGTGANVVNIGGANTTVNITGTVNNQAVTNLNVTDKLITINDGGAAASGLSAGIEVEEDGVTTAYVQTSTDRNSWKIKAPNTAGVVTLTPGASNDDVVLEDATQTLTNKTLTSPALTTPSSDIVTLDGQASTPANPSSGNYKMYVSDTTQKLTILNSAGVETAVGGGSGGINYISNPDAEAGTTGWVVYKDVAGTNPVDGTGQTSSPTLTWTASSSSPLRGNNSFLFTKDAANRQGEGASYDFTIDAADKAAMIRCTFDYAIASGTYADDDAQLWIYDVTNAALIPVTPYKLKNHSLTSERFSFEFQSAYNSTSYRLIIHCASTSASAYALKFDNIQLGPQVARGFGSVVTDWVSYAPTRSETTNQTVGINSWRRVGDSIEVVGRLAWSGSGSSSSAFAITLPSGLSIDSSKVSATGASSVLGSFQWTDNGVSYKQGIVNYYSATQYGFVLDNTGDWMIPSTFANGDAMTWQVTIPVVGLSAQSQIISTDAAQGVVALTAYNSSSGQSITGGATTTLTLNAVTTDKNGTWDTANNKAIIKVPGIYSASCFVGAAAGSSNVAAVYYRINSGTDIPLGINNMNTASGSAIIKDELKAGDIVEFRFYSDTSITLSNGTSGTRAALNLLQGPSQILAAQTVGAKLTGSSSTVSNSGATIITFDTTEFDYSSSVNGSKNRITPGVAGLYLVTANYLVRLNGTSAGVGTNAIIKLVKNGSVIESDVINAMAAGNWDFQPKITTHVRLTATDYLEIYGEQQFVGSAVAVSNAMFSVVKVGNY